VRSNPSFCSFFVAFTDAIRVVHTKFTHLLATVIRPTVNQFTPMPPKTPSHF
jgi:hypothetical protein